MSSPQCGQLSPVGDDGSDGDGGWGGRELADYKYERTIEMRFLAM